MSVRCDYRMWEACRNGAMCSYSTSVLCSQKHPGSRGLSSHKRLTLSITIDVAVYPKGSLPLRLPTEAEFFVDVLFEDEPVVMALFVGWAATSRSSSLNIFSSCVELHFLLCRRHPLFKSVRQPVHGQKSFPEGCGFRRAEPYLNLFHNTLLLHISFCLPFLHFVSCVVVDKTHGPHK